MIDQASGFGRVAKSGSIDIQGEPRSITMRRIGDLLLIPIGIEAEDGAAYGPGYPDGQDVNIR